MDNRIPIVVFTGAGASRAEPICLPTMTEFFQKIMDENHITNNSRIIDKDYFKFIFDTLYGNNKNYDLERVMGALYDLDNFTNKDCWKIFNHPSIYDSIANEIKRNIAPITNNSFTNSNSVNVSQTALCVKEETEFVYNNYKGKAKQLIFNLEWLIRETYEKIENEKIRVLYEPFFEMLFTKILNATNVECKVLPFFTTNYDMSIDWFFKPIDRENSNNSKKWFEKFEQKINYINGFDDIGWNKEIYNEVGKINEEIYVPYFKLHGSLFWEDVYGNVKMGTNTLDDYRSPRKLMLIYPSDKKVMLEDPYLFNQKQLENSLRNADNLIIIGFAFRDPEIVNTFRYAVENNENLKVYIIAPKYDPELLPDMDRFINQYKEKVTYLEGFFGTEEILNNLNEKLKC